MKILSGDFDPDLQTRQVEDFTNQGVDGICVSPTDSKAIAPAVKAALAAGIPVATIDSVAEGADTLSHVASDNLTGGKLAARLMIGALKEKGITEGAIAIIDHPTVTSVQDRTKGFHEVMEAEMPGITLEHFNAEGQRDKAMAQAEDAIQKYGDKLVGIFGINDDSVLGSLSAVERVGKLDTIILVGYDLGTESMAAIKEGKIVGDAVQFPGKMGTVALATVVKYVAGVETNPPKYQPIEVGTYTIKGFLNADGNPIK